MKTEAQRHFLPKHLFLGSFINMSLLHKADNYLFYSVTIGRHMQQGCISSTSCDILSKSPLTTVVSTEFGLLIIKAPEF